MKYAEWLDIWLENYIKPSVKVRTYERYALIIDKHISTDVGKCEISELSALVLQNYITKLLESGNCKTGNGLSANSVNAIISVLQSSLQTAHLIGVANEYTANKIKRPKLIERPVECFSLKEQKQIEQAVLNSKKDKLFGILLCLYSGLRIGELIALQWSDIDFAKGTLTVSKSCHDGKNGLIIDEPKTATSRRTIPLPKQLMPLVKMLKKRSGSFELLLKKLDIPHRGFHSLRHTFATRAIECGMDVKTLSEILGHKNPTVTLNRYAHSLMEHKQDMMNRLGKLL